MSTTDSLQENFIINVGSKANIEAAIQSGDITADMLSIVTDEDYYANVDLSNLSATGQTILNNKQDTLVSGTNIKTINNESLLGSGNISISSGNTYTNGTGIDITNNEISVTSPTLTNNSALGLAILGSVASGQRCTAIGYNATASNMGSIAINDSNGQATASGMYSISFGANSSATNTCSISIGYQANATNTYSIQLGYGTNSEANSFYVGTSSSNNYKLLGSDGKIPDDRLNTTIARVSDLPTVDQVYSGVSTNAQSGVAVKSAIDTAISSVYKPSGSVAYASLPTPTSSKLGNVYNVTNDFTTDARFIEGAGKTYPAGTNVVVIESNVSVTYHCYTNGYVGGSEMLYVLSIPVANGDDVYTYDNNTMTLIGQAVVQDGNITDYISNNETVAITGGQAIYDPTESVTLQSTSYFYDVLQGFIDLSGYQPLLVSGTNIKTVNNTSILGSGNIVVNSLPSQSGQSGKVLKTDGTDASWTDDYGVIFREWND